MVSHVSGLSQEGILPIHKIRIEQMVIIKENTEIASAYLDCKLSNNLLTIKIKYESYNITHMI